MRHSYTEAFHHVDEAWPDMPALSLLAEGPGIVQVELRTVWLNPIAVIRVDLQVPLVEAHRFEWDRGVFGHQVQFPQGAERYCLPRLTSPIADLVARSMPWERRDLFVQVSDWQFHWESFYDRVHRAIHSAYEEKIKTTRQRHGEPLVRTHLQRAISQLVNGGPTRQNRPTGWAENGASEKRGLPLTDEALTIRQMFEVEVGFPDIPGDDWLFEQIKLRFLAYLDGGCDITHTGKSNCGRQVIRVKPDDPISHVTGRPMSRLSLALNPLHGISNPKRTARENRSSCGALRLVNPIRPPIRSALVTEMPRALAERITTLNVMFGDVPGMNAWTADEETVEAFPHVKLGEELSLDGLLLTRTGRDKLTAYSSRNEIIPDDEYQERREQWAALKGFREQEIPELIEVMADGTLVHTRSWRVWWDEPIKAAFGKYKLTVGGIKGVGRPIHQLYCRVNGRLEPIDMVVSAQTVISKGAVDAILYPLAARAGLKEIDPTWTKEEIGTRVTAGLKAKGFPADGCFEIVRKQKVDAYGDTVLKPEDAALFRGLGVILTSRFENETLGRAICGPCPVVAAPEHEFRQSNAGKGVAIAIHPRLTVEMPFTHDERTARRVEKISRFYMETTGA